MSLLERTRRSGTDTDRDPRDWGSLGVAAGYGVVGALSLALVMLLPAIVAWVADPRSSVEWTDTLTFVGSAWSMVHAGSVSVPADGVQHVVLAPLLLTVLAVYLAKSSARAMISSLADRAGSLRAEWDVRGGFVAGYVGTGLVLVIASHLGAAPSSWWRWVPGALVVSVIGLLWADLTDDDDGESAMSRAWDSLVDRLPPVVPRALRPAAEGVLAFVGIGLVVVVLLAVTHLDRMSTLNTQLDAGVTGTAVLSLLQLTILPNLALYAGAWTTGASVHLGAVTLSGGSVQTGVLPMVPILGAVPDPGPLPGWLGVAPLLPVLLGAGIGWRASGRHTRLAPLTAKLGTAAGAAAGAAVVLVALIWAASAQVSPGALEQIGPSLLVLPLLLLELLIGACATACALHWVRTRR